MQLIEQRCNIWHFRCIPTSPCHCIFYQLRLLNTIEGQSHCSALSKRPLGAKTQKCTKHLQIDQPSYVISCQLPAYQQKQRCANQCKILLKFAFQLKELNLLVLVIQTGKSINSKIWLDRNIYIYRQKSIKYLTQFENP